MGRGGSCQACRKCFVEGDPSLMLAPVMGCPMTPHPLSGFLGSGMVMGKPWAYESRGLGIMEMVRVSFVMVKSVLRVV